MGVVRKWGDRHISNSLRQIDSSKWLIGNLVLHRLPYPSDTATWNDDSDGSSYTISTVASPLPTALRPSSPHITLNHEAGDASAVLSLGNSAFCKVRYIEDGVTPEPVTLDFVRDRHPSFEIPEVIYYASDDDRSYPFTKRVPGRTLDPAWPSLDSHWRRCYVEMLVKCCKEMAEWKGEKIGGVDGQNIPEFYLVDPSGSDDFDTIEASCHAIGMDVTDLVFFHADLGSTNILVEDQPSSGMIGIIDWEISGFLPKGWIRTKFRVSGGMDLSIAASASTGPTW